MKYFIYKNLVVNGEVLNQVVDENGKRLGVGHTVEEALKDANVTVSVVNNGHSPNMVKQDFFDV